MTRDDGVSNDKSQYQEVRGVSEYGVSFPEYTTRTLPELRGTFSVTTDDGCLSTTSHKTPSEWDTCRPRLDGKGVLYLNQQDETWV